ncbi:hypothetical protein CCMA1212_003554 [Trichoderma ghanense]|uniref:SSCRP protein n=1 Tax=Trichoderma ghanense TaxID=65468 RepID=A0ABY2H8A9_9HYPO
MLLSKFLPCILATCVAAAPVEEVPVAPVVSFSPIDPIRPRISGLTQTMQQVTLYREFGWTGPQFDVRGLDSCVKVANPLYAHPLHMSWYKRESSLLTKLKRYGHVLSAKLWPNSPSSRLCTLYSSNNCDSGTAILYVTTSNSPVNIRRNTDVRSVFCKDMKKKK